MGARNRFAALSGLAKVFVAAGLAAGIFGLATAVYASIPDSGGVIHGCYRTVGGTLRVIDASKQSCMKNLETPLTWNQAGAKGATGSRGPTGARGPTGTQTTSFWAVVNADGSVARGKGVTHVFHQTTGTYDVEFSSSINTCGWVGSGNSAQGQSLVTYSFVSTELSPGTTDTIRAQTTTSSGTPADRPFTLIVSC